MSADSLAAAEKGFASSPSKTGLEGSSSQLESVPVGRENISDSLRPHEDYEGSPRWDPSATWTEAEERRVVLKTDMYLLSWLCVMFFGLQLDRGNIQNALTNNFLKDLHLTTDDYNNGTTIQLLCFLACEFPVQVLTKRYGFRYVLPTMMMAWGTVSWSQAWITTRSTFYVTRALIGACEGGFIPGTILFAVRIHHNLSLKFVPNTNVRHTSTNLANWPPASPFSGPR